VILVGIIAWGILGLGVFCMSLGIWGVVTIGSLEPLAKAAMQWVLLYLFLAGLSRL
jgi:hypothetical protein